MFVLLTLGGSTATAIIYVMLRAMHSAMQNRKDSADAATSNDEAAVAATDR